MLSLPYSFVSVGFILNVDASCTFVNYTNVWRSATFVKAESVKSIDNIVLV